MLSCFGFNYESHNRDAIDKLKFLWIVKGMEGKPNDRYLQLLTKCRLCGQTNPTGSLLPREFICQGDISNTIRYPRNTWNQYTIDDLKKMGLRADKWDRNRLSNYMDQGITVPIQKEIRNLEIPNREINCINCGHLITYSAKDCFV